MIVCPAVLYCLWWLSDAARPLLCPNSKSSHLAELESSVPWQPLPPSALAYSRQPSSNFSKTQLWSLLPWWRECVLSPPEILAGSRFPGLTWYTALSIFSFPWAFSPLSQNHAEEDPAFPLICPKPLLQASRSHFSQLLALVPGVPESQMSVSTETTSSPSGLMFYTPTSVQHFQDPFSFVSPDPRWCISARACRSSDMHTFPFLLNSPSSGTALLTNINIYKLLLQTFCFLGNQAKTVPTVAQKAEL